MTEKRQCDVCGNCINQITSQSGEGSGRILLQKCVCCSEYIICWYQSNVFILIYTLAIFSIIVSLFLSSSPQYPTLCVLISSLLSFVTMLHKHSLSEHLNCFIRNLNNFACRQKRDVHFSYFVGTISTKWDQALLRDANRSFYPPFWPPLPPIPILSCSE